MPVKTSYLDGLSNYLLPPQHPSDVGKKTLVLDLDETLIHSVFRPVDNADMIIKIPDEITDHQGNTYSLTNDIYVFKRPGVDMFLKRLSRYYELVIFTASIDKYANPVIDTLDKNNLTRHRLYREHCTFMYNVFIKDLTKLGRKMEDILILDNSPISYLFQKQNALPIKTWLDDKNDIELYKYLRLLEYLARVDDVRRIITKIVDQTKNQIDFEIFDEIISTSNVQKEPHDRKQFYSESRKQLGPRFGYTSMLEAPNIGNLRQFSKGREIRKYRVRDDVELATQKLKAASQSKARAAKNNPPKELNTTGKNLDKNVLEINIDDISATCKKSTGSQSRINSAQYNASTRAISNYCQIYSASRDMVLGNSKKDLNDKAMLPGTINKSGKLFKEKLANLKVEDVINGTRAGHRAQRKSTSLLKPSTPSALKRNRNLMFGQDHNLSVHEPAKNDLGKYAKNTRGKIRIY